MRDEVTLQELRHQRRWHHEVKHGLGEGGEGKGVMFQPRIRRRPNPPLPLARGLIPLAEILGPSLQSITHPSFQMQLARTMTSLKLLTPIPLTQKPSSPESMLTTTFK